MFKSRGILSPRVKLGFALVAITLSLVLAAQSFGLLPSETKNAIEARARIAEALAIQLANAASHTDTELIELTIATVVARNDEVDSIAIRRADGRIVVASGDHQNNWPKPNINRKSTSSKVRIPLYRDSELWGRIEIAFKPLNPAEDIFGLSSNLLYLLAFLGVTGLLATDFVLRHTLREFDPNQTVPGRVQTAFDTMAEGVLIVDRRETVVLVNQAFQDLTKIAKQRLLGQRLNDLEWTWQDGSDEDRNWPWQCAVRDGTAQTNVSLALTMSDQERFSFVANSTPVLDAQGSIQGAIVTFDDVTLLEQKNEELQSAIGQLQELSTQLEKRVSERTRAAEQSAQVAVEANERLKAEVVERSRAETAVANQRDSLIQQQMALSGLTARIQIAGPDWLTSMCQLTETSGRLLGARRVSMWLDIEHTGSFHCVDAYSTVANRHATGGSLSSSAAPELFEDLQAGRTIVANDALEDPRTRPLEVKILAPNATSRLLAVPVMRDAVLEGVLLLESDADGCKWQADHQVFATAIANMASLILEARERQRVEDNLRQTNTDLIAATEAKSQFLANVSHELRTPMNGVFGMTDLLLRTSLSERQHKLVSTISHSAKSLLAIINDILDLSKIESGHMGLEVHHFQLNECVEDVMDLLAEQAQKKGLRFNLFVDTSAIGLFRGDAGRLRQVLLNLVGNAIKFTKTGEVRVNVMGVAGTVEPPAREIRFEVIDTGIGIDPNVQRQLFEPFSQADSSISRRFGGTGLGLSISKHLVEMMQGRIAFESRLGEGTRIWFDLVLPVIETADDGGGESPELIAGTRVLIVDDDPTAREIAAAYLKAPDVELAMAETIADGVAELECAALDNTQFDLAIVDGDLDRSSDYAFAKFVHKASGPNKLEVIWLTSVPSDAEADLAKIEPSLNVASKPMRRPAFVMLVRNVLQPPAPQINRCDDIESTGVGLPSRVLVAEDNAVNQFVAMEYLDELGCEVVIADNGRHAVERARSEEFDIILMDCQMPDMDGVTAAKLISEEKCASGRPVPPIIAMTGKTTDEKLLACEYSGMVDILAKPYSAKALRNMLHKWSSPATNEHPTSGTSAARSAAETISA